MITHSYTVFGHVFATAVSDVAMVVVRKDDSATGYSIAVDVKIWATAAARTADAEIIDKRKVIFGDSFESTFVALNRPISNIFDGTLWEESGDMILAIETDLLNLPEWTGGTIS